MAGPLVEARQRGVNTSLSPLLKTPTELAHGSPLRLDMIARRPSMAREPNLPALTHKPVEVSMTNLTVCLPRVVALSVTLAVLAPSTAAAQASSSGPATSQTAQAPWTPTFDVFAGVGLWQEDERSLRGLHLSGAVRASRHVAFVGDLAFYDGSSVPFFPPRSTVRTLMGGVRVYIPLQWVTLFGQVLAGSAPLDDFALQPGAGLDVHLTRRVAIRVAGDVKVSGDDGSTYVGRRISTGVVFLLGRQ